MYSIVFWSEFDRELDVSDRIMNEWYCSNVKFFSILCAKFKFIRSSIFQLVDMTHFKMLKLKYIFRIATFKEVFKHPQQPDTRWRNLSYNMSSIIGMVNFLFTIHYSIYIKSCCATNLESLRYYFSMTTLFIINLIRT